MSRTKGVCAQCMRNHHDQCTLPGRCECVTCYVDDPDLPQSEPGIVWEDPPRGRPKDPPVTGDVAAALREQPGRWARIRHYKSASGASTQAKKVRTGYWPELPAGDWEASGARNGDGSWLYVRYVGKTS